MAVEIRHKTTHGAIDSVRHGLPSFANNIETNIYAKAARGHYYGAEATMPVFFDPRFSEEHKCKLERNVEAEEQKLAQVSHLTDRRANHYQNHFAIDLRRDGFFAYARNNAKLDDLAVNFGYFCVLTNTYMDSSAILSVYRDRDAIEKGFDELKNYVDMRRLRTHNQETTEGKMF